MSKDFFFNPELPRIKMDKPGLSIHGRRRDIQAAQYYNKDKSGKPIINSFDNAINTIQKKIHSFLFKMKIKMRAG
jgi:hypothetical protein